MLQDFLTTRYIEKMNFYEFDSMNFRKILLFVYTFLEVSCSLLNQDWFYVRNTEEEHDCERE